MTLRVVLVLALAGAAACASSSKTPEPTEPARSVSTASAAPAAEAEPAAAAAAAAGGDAAALDPRLVEMLVLLERFVVTLEAAEGDCDRTVDAIAEFAHGDDGKAMRRLAADEELRALAKGQVDAIKASRPTLEARFVAVLEACPDQARVGEALDESRLFVKVRDDGTIIAD